MGVGGLDSGVWSVLGYGVLVLWVILDEEANVHNVKYIAFSIDRITDLLSRTLLIHLREVWIQFTNETHLVSPFVALICIASGTQSTIHAKEIRYQC